MEALFGAWNAGDHWASAAAAITGSSPLSAVIGHPAGSSGGIDSPPVPPDPPDPPAPVEVLVAVERGAASLEHPAAPGSANVAAIDRSAAASESVWRMASRQ
jgi:hypothetical protein